MSIINAFARKTFTFLPPFAVTSFMETLLRNIFLLGLTDEQDNVVATWGAEVVYLFNFVSSPKYIRKGTDLNSSGMVGQVKLERFLILELTGGRLCNVKYLGLSKLELFFSIDDGFPKFKKFSKYWIMK